MKFCAKDIYHRFGKRNDIVGRENRTSRFPRYAYRSKRRSGRRKTTLAKGIGAGLGVTDIINSPTFTILKIYQGRLPLYHFDVYRLDEASGDDYLEEYFYAGGVSVIEWADNIDYLLPDDFCELISRLPALPHGKSR